MASHLQSLVRPRAERSTRSTTSSGPLPQALALCLLTAACGGSDPPPGPSSSPATPAPEAQQTIPRDGETHDGTARPGVTQDLPLVVFLGDSITAGYGLSGDEAFPSLVEAVLIDSGFPIRIVNAGVSGDTTTGGLSRLEWVLRQDPDLVVVELGANDALQGLPLEHVERNLREIVRRCVDSGVDVVVAGMRVPTSYGPEYGESFHALFARVAGEAGVELIPFLLEGVAGDPSRNLPDGIHPTAEGHRVLARTVLPYVEGALRLRPQRP